MEFFQMTRSQWKRTHRDYKGWLVIDGQRVRAVLTWGVRGTTLAPVKIVPDPQP